MERDRSESERAQRMAKVLHEATLEVKNGWKILQSAAEKAQKACLEIPVEALDIQNWNHEKVCDVARQIRLSSIAHANQAEALNRQALAVIVLSEYIVEARFELVTADDNESSDPEQ